MLTVFAAALLVYVLHGSWLFRRLETANLDSWLLSRQTFRSSMVIIVTVADQEFATLFNNRNPLDQRRVKDILGAIADANPRLIVVDIDTSAWTERKVETVNPNVTIIWARDAIERGGQLELLHFEGGDEKGTCSAVPVFSPDGDGIIRTYERYIKDTRRQWQPSLARRATAVFQKGVAACQALDGPGVGEEQNREEFLSALCRFDRLSATAALKLHRATQWQELNPLKGKIVILGGTFRAGRDRYATSLGMLDGVEVLAQSIESEISQQRPRAATKRVVFLVDVLLGLLFIIVVYFIRRPWMLMPLFILLPIIAILGSLVAFQTIGYYASVIPVLAGLFGHELLDHIREGYRLRSERAILLRRLEATRLG
jgi:CHASE2 domain-containing sensor protein